MTGLPVLTIYIALSSDGTQSYYLKSRLSDGPEPTSEVLSTLNDVGRLDLPFPLHLVPHIQSILDIIQSSNKTIKQQLFQGDKRDELKDIENELRDLKLLDNSGFILLPYSKVLEHLGDKIGKVLLTNPVFKKNLEAFYDAARQKGGDIVFNFDQKTLELAAIPWELASDGLRPLLVHPRGGDILLSCTRVILGGYQPPLHAINRDLRVLAVASYAGMDGPARSLEQEARRGLAEALNSLQEVNIDDNSPLRGFISLKALGEKLIQDARVDILDYYGHGHFDESGYATLSMFGDESSGEVKIPTIQLMALQNLPPLIVLHVCHSAQIDSNNVQGSLAPVLSGHDSIDAVIAMQGEIQMQIVAHYITPVLYDALADHESLPRAVARVRQRLFSQEKNKISWFVPVLYMRIFSQASYIPLEQIVTPQNPFLEQLAIDDAEFFVGRQEQVRNIGKLLRAGRSLAIIGRTSCGKTSMLKYIADKINVDDKLKIGKEVNVVWLPVQMNMKRDDAETYIVPKIGGVEGDKLEDLLGDKHLILLLDDLGVLDQKEDAEFLTWLKNLLRLKVQLIITNEESLKGSFARLSKQHSLFAGQITIEMQLKPFTREEARSFIIAKLKGLRFKVDQFEKQLKDSMSPGEVESACWGRFDELLEPPL